MRFVAGWAGLAIRASRISLVRPHHHIGSTRACQKAPTLPAANLPSVA